MSSKKLATFIQGLNERLDRIGRDPSEAEKHAAVLRFRERVAAAAVMAAGFAIQTEENDETLSAHEKTRLMEACVVVDELEAGYRVPLEMEIPEVQLLDAIEAFYQKLTPVLEMPGQKLLKDPNYALDQEELIGDLEAISSINDEARDFHRALERFYPAYKTASCSSSQEVARQTTVWHQQMGLNHPDRIADETLEHLYRLQLVKQNLEQLMKLAKSADTFEHEDMAAFLLETTKEQLVTLYNCFDPALKVALGFANGPDQELMEDTPVHVLHRLGLALRIADTCKTHRRLLEAAIGK